MLRLSFVVTGLFLGACLSGCGSDPLAPQAPPAGSSSPPPASSTVSGTPPAAPTAQTEKPKTAGPVKREFKPLQLGGGTATNSPAESADSVEGGSIEDVFDALQPLNILVGQWNTTTKTQGAGEAAWKIDPATARTQPTLLMTTKDNPYFKEGRLTYLPAKNAFRLTATDVDGEQRVYEGQYTEPPQLVEGDDGKPQRTYKLKLDEVGNEDARKLVAVEFNQQESNRMLMAVYRRVGKTAQVQDTVANQRQNTSFALSDSNYKERECIVSQGLGTTTVNFMGRTFYVCCSGCEAAFNDNPAFWIAQAEEREKKKAE
jgi:hypothetical protein